MAQAKRKTTTAPAQTADADLFKLHDAFCKTYAAVLQLRGGGAGSLDTGTTQEKARQRKWEHAVNIATDKANAVIAAPAVTLEGMLMKIHVAGFAFDCVKPGTFRAPYSTGIQHWEPSGLAEGRSEIALIVSLRDDLHRLSGRRS
jgi:hypothetical protein